MPDKILLIVVFGGCLCLLVLAAILDHVSNRVVYTIDLMWHAVFVQMTANMQTSNRYQPHELLSSCVASCGMCADAISERAGKLWIQLRETQEKHGKDSSEYHGAMINWVKFLRKEAKDTRARAELGVKELNHAYNEVCKAKNRYGENSASFDKAEKKFQDIEIKLNKTINDIDPIFRAVMSL